jgi:hypothetical protein
MLNYSPYTGGTNQNTPLHLSTLLSQAGKTWKSYQEDIDLARNSAGQVINVPLPQDQWSVPLTSFSGTFGSNLPESQGFLFSNVPPAPSICPSIQWPQ